MEVKSIYELYPEIFDGYAEKFPNVVALAKVMKSFENIDEALGGATGVSYRWVKGMNPPGYKSESKARNYFLQMAHGMTPAAPKVVEPPADQMFIISVPVSAKAKAEMLMGMMRNIGCSIVDF